MMDAHLFRLFATMATPFLEDARVEKIREPASGLFSMTLYARGQKKQFHMRYGKKDQFCFLGEARFSSGGFPPGLIMRIRKHFTNRRFGAVVFQFCQRKLWLMAAGSPGENQTGKAAWLCLDLVRGPEIHFLDPGQTPEPDNPLWPAGDQITDALKNWRQWPIMTPLLRKTIAGLDKFEQKALIEDLRAGGGYLYLYSRLDGITGSRRIVRASAWPVPTRPDESVTEAGAEELAEAFEKAGNDLVLARIFATDQDRIFAPARRRLGKLRKLLPKLEQDEKRLQTMRAREADALALREHIWQWDKNEHLEKVMVQRAGDAVEIPLDARFSILENMERFFHDARRGKRGLAMLEERRAAILAEMAALENPQAVLEASAGKACHQAHGRDKATLAPLQNGLPKNVQLLVSTDGYALLRGRDAKGNRAALKLAAPHDLWAHVETGPGAHVIIRRRHPADVVPETTLAEAGSLAASKSWLKDSASASIMYAEARHVKPARNGPAGKVTIDRIAMTRIVRVERDVEQRLATGTHAG